MGLRASGEPCWCCCSTRPPCCALPRCCRASRRQRRGGDRRGRDRLPQRPGVASARPARAAAHGPHARPRGAAAQRDPRHLRVDLIPGAHVDGVLEGIVIRRISGLTRSLWLLAIDEDDPGTATSSAARRGAGDIGRHRRPGLLFLEIDGLAHDVLRARAARRQRADARALGRDGRHRLERWETDWSSQTGACQAGLLHGYNDDMPAFRWWEKDRARDRHQPPARRGRARAPPLRRPRACCTTTARAARTSSPATRRTRC